ncbi:MAG TPA: TetR/AcrR family transcriptional regulator [Vicinamibacterales bacterium]
MAPRPRTISDADVLMAAQRTIARLGPARVTLADVASEARLAPATLVQRFGSKRGLLLALVEMAANSVDACFAEIRAMHRSPMAALVAAATEMTRQVKSPDELANGLAFLQLDVSDPDFHRVAIKNSRRLHAGYKALLDEAVAAGELAPCDTAHLARTVGAVSGGSLIAWAIMRDGSAEHWVREDLMMLLAPYRPRAEALPAVPSPRAPAKRPRRRRGTEGG